MPPRSSAPMWMKHTAIVLAATIAFMAVAAYAAVPWWEFAFLSDGSPVAWLSGALLVANASVALTLTLGRLLPPVLGSTLTGALAVLALDEEFLFHEIVTDALGASWGNLATAMVGAGGVAMLVLLWRAIASRPARILMAAAVVVGVLALWVDLGNPPATIARLEEAFEALAESLFLSGLLEISRRQVQSDC